MTAMISDLMRPLSLIPRIAAFGLAVACAWAAPAGSVADTRGAASVSWKGRELAGSALPADLPASVGAALDAWRPWALAHDYRFDIESTGRIVLVAHRNQSGVAKHLADAERALALLDKRLPRLQAGGPASPAGVPPKGSDVLPEDPEAPTAGPGRSWDEVGAKHETQWGADARELDTGSIVVFLLRDERDMEQLLERLVEGHPALAAWRAGASRHPGFALEWPLVGAVVLGAAGQEEFDPANELVHRVAELSLLRRVGRQPYWVLQGWAWHVELSVRRSLYCFPYRDGFVGVGEHSGWDRSLRSMWSKAASPLAMSDIGALQRGGWDDRAAKHAWGAITYVDRFHPDQLPALLEDLRAAWDRGSRKDLGAGRWERDIGFELSPTAQLAVLHARLGPDVLEKLARFFTTGAGPEGTAR